MNPETSLCPICHNRLYEKKNSFAVCKNRQCAFYWKLGGWGLKNSVWVYQDNDYDKDSRWDKAHGYSPRKFEIAERHLAAMVLALEKDGSLCFVIPEKYCLPNSEVLE